MSIRSVGRRQARQMKQAGKWEYSQGNKKGAEPRQAAPFQNRHRDMIRPSRKGVGTPPE